MGAVLKTLGYLNLERSSEVV
ncbi:unnamed protein product [Discula destructiva]